MTIIQRVWAMPNRDTFDIRPIGEMVKRFIEKSMVSIDPFSRNKRWATYTNDLNEETEAEYHMDAIAFMEMLVSKNVKADLIILDPPYSMHQQTVTYGQTRKIVLTPIYDMASEILDPGGYCLSFGFNSNGLGMRRNFSLEEIVLVAHGGHHNDTICIVERKLP